MDTVFDSWFFLGKLGGFNAENLQVQEEGAELSWMGYDQDSAARALPALMHNMGVMEYRADWARCWLDLGNEIDNYHTAYRRWQAEAGDITGRGIHSRPSEEAEEDAFSRVANSKSMTQNRPSLLR